MTQIGLWMRENPFLAFIIILAIVSSMSDCGVELAKAVRR